MTRIIVQFYESKEKTVTVETDSNEAKIESYQDTVTVIVNNPISDEDVPF